MTRTSFKIDRAALRGVAGALAVGGLSACALPGGPAPSPVSTLAASPCAQIGRAHV